MKTAAASLGRRHGRSSFVRLGALVTVSFLAANSAAFLAAWRLASADMTGRLQATLSAEMEDLRAVAAAEGPAALVEEIEERARDAAPGMTLHQLWTADGTHGDLALAAPVLGFAERGEDALSLPEGRPHAEDYILLGARIGEADLVLGHSADAREETIEIFAQALMAGLGLSAMLATGGVLLFLGRAERRLAAIDDALAAAAEGDLSARAPLRGNGDDLDRIASAINGALARLEDNVASLRQVSADIAHDLRTPLQRLRASIERMEDRPGPEAVDDALAQIDGIAASFRALLRIAQIEGGGPKAGFSPVDLGTLAGTLAELYAAEAEEEGRAFEVSIAPDLPTIEGDADLLGQMIANLLANALRHAPAPAAVALRVARAGDALEIVVEDRGPGVPEAEREKVFRRLYRLERSRTTPGSGLGLSMVAAAARLHGGAAVLEDAAPGLRARVRLPLG